MTEEEWLAGTRMQSIVQSKAAFVRGKGSERKHRLLACACCEAYRKEFEDTDILRAAMDVAQRTADEPSDQHERAQEIDLARSSPDYDYRDEYYGRGAPILACGTREEVERVPSLILESHAYDININAREVVCSLLHCIFGNPFRPVTFDPRWRTSDVVGLAQAIYDDKAFERMPILADALMDAGCVEEQIIGHCRGEGPHVRGCWVVDLALGKT